MSEPVAVLTPDLGSPGPIGVSAWFVEVGETVRSGDRLVELLLPGVTYDVAAPVSGRLAKVFAALNADVTTGDLLGYIDPDEDL